ncbi:MAG: transposase, partial [Gammaproteobacteria bacterium]|nr:transposase [Gammaproteobacteria bacterium]
CEKNGLYYVLGLARNARLNRILRREMHWARQACKETGQAARCYRDFTYRTRKSWSRKRRVIGKAEHLPGKANPRFVVTNLPAHRGGAQHLYEKLYCIRGEMENRIKEQQLGLFADRTSTAMMQANQLRLYFSSFAYVLMHGLRRLGLAGTDLAKAQCTTIRVKLLKIGMRLRISVRKVWLSFSESYPYTKDFVEVLRNLRCRPVWVPPG